MFWGIDPVYLAIIAPGMLLSIVAQIMISSAYAKASKIVSRRGMTGADVAKEILRLNEIHDVVVEPIDGTLTDHYHPGEKRLRLSNANYHGNSLAALGVSAHEVGHAIQHAQGYAPLHLRSLFVPVASIGSNLGFMLFLIGLVFVGGMETPVGKYMIYGGIALFSAVVLFTLITLPVELNASSRALAVLSERNIVTAEEMPHVRRVLRAAALTYVAAALMAVLQLAYMISRARER